MRLVAGKGNRDDGTACWMSMISWANGEIWTDKSECVAPEIRSLAIWVNDNLPTDDDRRRVIMPHWMTPAGTRTDDPYVTARRLDRIVAFARQQAAEAAAEAAQAPNNVYAAYAASYAARAARVARAAGAAAGAAVEAARSANSAANAAVHAGIASYVYAAAQAAEHRVLPLILELCAMSRREITPVRSLAELGTTPPQKRRTSDDN